MLVNNNSVALLTGGSGFVGGYLLPLLDNYVSTVSITHNHKKNLNAHKCTWYTVDLLKLDNFTQLISEIQPDYLIHLAWSLPHQSYWTSKANVTWLQQSMKLINAFLQAGGKHIHIAGTCAEYDWNEPMPLYENLSSIKPRGKYGKCKNALRVFATRQCVKYKATLGWYRIFWLYGNGQDESKFIPGLIASLLAGKAAECKASNLKRDYIHVQDAAKLIFKGIRSNFNGIVNIGSGTGAPLGLIALKIARLLGRDDLLTFTNRNTFKDEPEIIYASTNLQQRLFTDGPIYSLDDGLKKTILEFNR